MYFCKGLSLNFACNIKRIKLTSVLLEIMISEEIEVNWFKFADDFRGNKS